MNITLIVGIFLIILGLRAGFKTGFVGSISRFIALIATVITLALLLMLFTSFHAGETKNALITLVIIVILSAVYGTVRFLLRGMKAVSNLPVIKFFDKLLGGVIGILRFFMIYIIMLWMGLTGLFGKISERMTEDIVSSPILTLICEKFLFF